MDKKLLLSTTDNKQIMEVFQALNQTSDDYFFILDIKEDSCFFCDRVLERFHLSSDFICPAGEGLRELVAEEDFPLLLEDLRRIRTGEKKYHDMEYRWYGKDMEIIWIHCRGTVIYDGGGSIRLLVGSISEVNGEEKRDRLTGLHGESRFALDLGRLLQKEQSIGFLLLLGVDDFKEINEKYGIESGNVLLRELADIIRECMQPGMQLYRLVADEFVLFGQGNVSRGQVTELFEKIRRNIFRHIEEEDYRSFYTVSGGLLQSPYPSGDYGELVKYLEFALNEAKRRGKNGLVVFSREDYDDYVGRLEIKEELRKAIFNDYEGFSLHYQPIVDAKNYEIRGAEALLRWESSKYGKMPPGDFIPVMEESGLIIPMGSYVMEEAVRCCCRLKKFIPAFHMNINLSYVQLKKSDVLQELRIHLGVAEVCPENIMLEITESGYIETDPAFRKAMEEICGQKLRLAIDDFGTGYSNLRYLKDLRADMIKIDRSFAVKALESEYDYTLLGHIIEMAHSIGLQVCLEGVETEEELVRLQRLSPDYIQGFLFGRPVPETEFVEKYLKNSVNKAWQGPDGAEDGSQGTWGEMK
ncbi:putative bifunctional diguanylate cyclase/phosphodiesterase [Eisenbergiella sp.]